jgi:hypothetical protein
VQLSFRAFGTRLASKLENLKLVEPGSAAASGRPDLTVEQVNELMGKISSGEPGAANRMVRQLCCD